jgi:hypothetical protein
MEIQPINITKHFKIKNDLDLKTCMVQSVPHSEKDCKKKSHMFTDGMHQGIEYTAKLNIPFIPTRSKQCVLGTTKYLLPYMCLPKHFVTFAFKPHIWNEQNNSLLLFCIVSKFFKQTEKEPIRLVTTPNNIKTNNSLTITGKEICQLSRVYNMYFYKLVSSEYNNIYFIYNYEVKESSYIKLVKSHNLIHI